MGLTALTTLGGATKARNDPICVMPPQVAKARKAGLHFGDYHSKLLHFESQKIFSMFKKGLSLEPFSS
jgi:hypothetical protein